MFARRLAIMSSRRLGRQKNVTLKTSSVRLDQDECLLGGKRSSFIFQHGKCFIEMQLVYLIVILESIYNIVHDLFETGSVNVMKNRPLVAKIYKGNFNIY